MMRGRVTRRLTCVADVRKSVQDSVESYHPAHHFVELDVLIQGEEPRQRGSPDVGQTFPQHQHQDKHTVKVEIHSSDSCH